MIVKILKNSSNAFSAVDYNSKRMNQGEAVFLGSRNMDNHAALCESLSDYKKYLIKWTEKNENIKKGQLHVVFSCKGGELTPEDLMSQATQWLDRMGYDKTPSLFFFHRNTYNNHIHVVTSRVDADGKKIEDSFEKNRSLNVLRQLEGKNVNSEIRRLVVESLRYSFASVNQFMMVLESQGFKCKKESDKLSLMKNGEKVSLNLDLIVYCQKRYHNKITVSQKYKLKSIVNKYSMIMNKNDFLSYMRQAFGLSFIFFGKTDSPYGYAIVDHKTHAVYTGRQILSLKQLSININNNSDIKDICKEILKDLMDKHQYCSSKTINKEFSKYDIRLDGDSLVDKTTSEIIIKIDEQICERIKYNNRLSYVRNTFDPQSLSEYSFLCKIYSLEESDLKKIQTTVKTSHRTKMYNQYKSLIQEATKTLDIGKLQDLGISVVRNNEEILFYDKSNDVLLSNVSLGYEYNEFLNMFASKYIFDNDIENGEKEDMSLLERYNKAIDIISGVLMPDKMGSETGSRKKRKRRY